jgi:seryl-tRNA synthetase
MLPDGGRSAVSSHNYHSDFFGRAFNIDVEGAGPMHSVCVGFGYERWVHAFIQQHGGEPGKWPDAVRRQPEFRDLG